MTASIVSLGGVTVGLCILTWIIVRWWQKQRPSWQPLVPFIGSALYGMLLILSAGGLLGGIAGIALWGSNELGDAALEYGVGGNSPAVNRPSPLGLTDGGHAMVLILTVAFIAMWKFSKKMPKKDIALGVLCGICMGLSAGVAGWAADILAPVVSWCGDWIVGLL